MSALKALRPPEPDKQTEIGKEVNWKMGRSVIRAQEGLSWPQKGTECDMKETPNEHIRTAPILYSMPKLVLSYLVLLLI